MENAFQVDFNCSEQEIKNSSRSRLKEHIKHIKENIKIEVNKHAKTFGKA